MHGTGSSDGGDSPAAGARFARDADPSFRRQAIGRGWGSDMGSTPSARQLARKASSRTRRALLAPMLRLSNVDDLIRLGSPSCGWWVPERVLRPGAIAYCAGAGLDISFDLDLHSRGLTVVTIDPTPRSVAYVGGVRPDDDRFHFLPLGLWNERDELSFYAPSVPSDISHSVLNLQQTEEFFTAPVDSLAGCMARMQHDRVDLLKVDIEGAESTVLPDLLENGPYPVVVCFEYDQPQSIFGLRKLLRQFDSGGYQLICRERWNFTLLLMRGPSVT